MPKNYIDEPKNMNELARAISVYEVGGKEMSIAQIKEILAILSDYVAHDPLTIIPMLMKNAKKRG